MNKKIAIKWYKQAVHDLEMAEKNIEIKGYDIAAFLAHQAVEKLLKAIFALEGKEIPKIHYVDELAHKLGLSKDLTDSIVDLTIDYTLARYPDVSERVPYEEYNQEMAKAKVQIAKEVFLSLKDRYEILEEEK